jgi:hypothetical protein
VVLWHFYLPTDTDVEKVKDTATYVLCVSARSHTYHSRHHSAREVDDGAGFFSTVFSGSITANLLPYKGRPGLKNPRTSTESLHRVLLKTPAKRFSLCVHGDRGEGERADSLTGISWCSFFFVRFSCATGTRTATTSPQPIKHRGQKKKIERRRKHQTSSPPRHLKERKKKKNTHAAAMAV